MDGGGGRGHKEVPRSPEPENLRNKSVTESSLTKSGDLDVCDGNKRQINRLGKGWNAWKRVFAQLCLLGLKPLVFRSRKIGSRNRGLYKDLIIPVWNRLIESNPNLEIYLYAPYLFKADLKDINLRNAYLGAAHLGSADLRHANLNRAVLRDAFMCMADLRYANLKHSALDRVELQKAKLQCADLRYANLEDADLKGADLKYADLRHANLNYANLNNTDLSHANLSHASLIGTQVLYTKLTETILDGVCIKDWQIGDGTKFENVKCDYIFRAVDFRLQDGPFTGRLPVDSASTFAPGEFSQRFQIIASALETIDITFTQGIDWQAFFQSFQALRDSRPDKDMSIQGMERKGDAFVVRLEVEAEADKASIETEIKRLYFGQIDILEAQYEKQLRLQGVQIEEAKQTIESERREKANLMEIMAIMAENQGSKYDMRGSNFGSFVETAQSGSRFQTIQHIYAPEQEDLSKAAKEIQSLLNTLSVTYNTTTESDQEKLMKELRQEIEKHPKWRRALKEGGIELIKVLCAPIGVPLEIARVYLEEE